MALYSVSVDKATKKDRAESEYVAACRSHKKRDDGYIGPKKEFIMKKNKVSSMRLIKIGTNNYQY